MKIAFFIEHISNGGAERVITNLANIFSEHGHECVMITTLRRNDEYFLSSKVRRYVTQPNGYTNSRFGGFKRLHNLRNILKSEKPEYLVSFLNSALYHGVLTTRFLPVKSIISVRNDPNFDYQTLLSRILAKTILPFSEGAVFQTEDAKKWFPKKLRNKSTIIYNPIAKVFYETEHQPSEKSFVAVGRLSQQKNFKLLIDAFSKVNETNPDWILKIYGDGELYEELGNQITELDLENKVFLCGRSTNVAKDISAASIFVMSSDFEGAPNALMEAMAVGMPVISTDCPCGGPRMLINAGVDGELVEVGNKDHMVDMMQLLAKNEELRKTLAKGARQKAGLFTEESVYQKWYNYIKQL